MLAIGVRVGSCANDERDGVMTTAAVSSLLESGTVTTVSADMVMMMDAWFFVLGLLGSRRVVRLAFLLFGAETEVHWSQAISTAVFRDAPAQALWCVVCVIVSHHCLPSEIETVKRRAILCVGSKLGRRQQIC